MSDDEPTAPVVLPQVEVESGGHRVSITAPNSLDDLVTSALKLWHATDDKAITKGYGAVGFHTEMCPESVGGDESPLGFGVA